jgi:hypothetical protein
MTGGSTLPRFEEDSFLVKRVERRRDGPAELVQVTMETT